MYTPLLEFNSLRITWAYLSKETRKALADAFHKLASRGRKQELTPFLYTQSISEVAKSVFRQAGVKVLMRQTLDVDLTRYCQYIQGATARTKRAIAALPSGKALVIVPDGSQHRVQFHQRQSAHVSHTPQAHTALVTFAAMQIDVTTLPMRDLTAPGPAEQGHLPRHLSVPPHQGKPGPIHHPMTEQVYDLLSRDPTLRPVDLRKLVGCDAALAGKVRAAYFERHPEQEVEVERRKRPEPVAERVYALLAENPTLRPVDLAKLAECSETTASRARAAYFERRPEQRGRHEQGQEG